MKSNIVSVSLIDNSEFVAGRSWNGGGYSFRRTFRKVADGVWEQRYSTSADFGYCQYCGTFGNCECKEPVLFTDGEVENIVIDFEDSHEGDPDYDIDWVTKESVEKWRSWNERLDNGDDSVIKEVLADTEAERREAG